MPKKHTSFRITSQQADQVSALLGLPENKGVTNAVMLRYLLDVALTVAFDSELRNAVHDKMIYQKVKEKIG